MASTTTRRKISPRNSPLLFLAAFVLLGALAGFTVLHPLALTLFWLEFSETLEASSGYLNFIQGRMRNMIGPENVEMGAIFALIGGTMGLIFGLIAQALMRRETDIRLLAELVSESIPELIAAGEGARVEFKSTARWDLRENKPNKALEAVIAKTIVGFLNARGGNLIIGVADDGTVCGLEMDYKTLRQKNRDGFEQMLMEIVKRYAGAASCPYVHSLISDVDGLDVCLVRIEPAPQPVYLTQGGKSEFYLRTGNATRLFDSRETMDYASKRWPK